MVNVRIPTWAHNCGMHVIADFLIEKLKRDDFSNRFSCKPYDALLKMLQICYQEENLTWEIIREASLKTTRVDAQIVLGFALRQMLPDILKLNSDYKKDLGNNFLAALRAYKEGKLIEVETSYPIILSGNINYFQSQALIYNTRNEADLNYWNETGFNNYCGAILAVFETPDEDENYLWLGQEELILFCEYFGIGSVIVNNTSDEPYDSEKIFFHNPEGVHWERQVDFFEPENIRDLINKSDFYKIYLSKGHQFFVENAHKIGKMFFSKEYLTLDCFGAAEREEENKILSSLGINPDDKISLDVAVKKSYSFLVKNKNDELLYLQA